MGRAARRARPNLARDPAAGRPRPAPGAAAAARRYAALHDGVPPDALVWEKPQRQPKFLVDIGRAHAVEYFKTVDDKDGKGRKDDVLYRHVFRREAAPTFAHDDQGQLRPLGGHYTTTDRGITDMKVNYRSNPSGGGSRSRSRGSSSMPGRSSVTGRFLSGGRGGSLGFRRNASMGYYPYARSNGGGILARMNEAVPGSAFVLKAVGAAVGAAAISGVVDMVIDETRLSERARSAIKTFGPLVAGGLLYRRMPFTGAAFIGAGAVEGVQWGLRETGLDRRIESGRARLRAWIAARGAPAAGGTTAPPTSGADFVARGSAQQLGDGRRMPPNVDAIREKLAAAQRSAA